MQLSCPFLSQASATNETEQPAIASNIFKQGQLVETQYGETPVEQPLVFCGRILQRN